MIGTQMLLYEVEVLHGKLISLVQINPPFKHLLSEITDYLRDLIRKYIESEAKTEMQNHLGFQVKQGKT